MFRHMVVDRFSTKEALCVEAYKRGWLVTGTVGKQYVPAEAKEIAVNERGDWGHVSKNVGARHVKNLVCYKWVDNGTVYLMSTAVYPNAASVERKCPGELVKKEFSAPTVAVEFNGKMGGVDAADARRSAYTSDRRRTKKWTTKFWYFSVDVAANNAYVLASKVCSADLSSRRKRSGVYFVERQAFQMAIARGLITRGLNGQTIEEKQAEDNVRGLHLPKYERTDGGDPKRLSCQFDGCSARPSSRCSTCGVVLCCRAGQNCHYEYHMQHTQRGSGA